MKRILYACTLFSLVSCATYQVEQVDGAQRVQISQDSYKKPQFYIKKFKPSKKRIYRGIASIESEEKELKLSNKKAYFLSLWKQYNTLSKITKTHDQVNSCPQFHNDILTFDKELKGQKVSKIKMDFTNVLVNSNTIYSYPVLSLPYKKTDLYSYLNQANKWNEASKHVEKALSNYKSTLKSEIQTLCEHGNSNEYYIYENMISYYNSNEDFLYSYKALPSVLKVAPISNIFLIGSLIGDTGKISRFESKILSQMNIPWFKKYIYEVSQVRNNKEERFVLND